jgi:hypothetical protein
MKQRRAQSSKWNCTTHNVHNSDDDDDNNNKKNNKKKNKAIEGAGNYELTGISGSATEEILLSLGYGKLQKELYFCVGHCMSQTCSTHGRDEVKRTHHF